MEGPDKFEDLKKPDTKIFITPQFKTFIKAPSYVNKNTKLIEKTLQFLAEDFETEDVDFDKVYAENEFYHLRDTNEEVKAKWEAVDNLNKHREMIRQVGILNHEARLKSKLLEKLENGSNNHGQKKKDFDTKFEKIIKKDNNTFIEKLFVTMKKIKGGIGLEFPGSLDEEVTRGHQELLSSMTTMEPGFEVKGEKGVYHSFMLEDGFMLNFMENINNEGRIEWFTKFMELRLKEKSKSIDMVELKCDYEFRSEQRIHDTKYFPEGNILVITSTLAQNDKNLMINVFELIRNKDSVTFEPKHSIKTNGRWAEFVRAGGTEYLIYCNDLDEEDQFKKLTIMNFEETFINSKTKPNTETMDLDISCFKTCNLGGGYVVVEGPKNTLGLIELSTKEVLGYYKDHKGEDYFNYLRACYSKTKNVLFVMHNSQNGAVVSVFGVDQSSSELIVKQNFEFYNDLKSSTQQSFASRYFEMQFNHGDSRLDIVDDFQTTLFRFKLDEECKLKKDKDAIKLSTEGKDCTPTFLMTRLDGDLYFLQYFTFANHLVAYPIVEKD